MKKITTLIALACVSSFGFAQSQRLCLAEEFTQASCPPCAAQNPAYNALLAANTNKIISIKYQTSWPGVDPMNAQTQSEVGPRVSYYSVSGVPNARVDGTIAAGAPSSTTQTVIDNEYNVPSSFTMNLTHSFSSDMDSIFISCDVTCSQNITMTTPKLHVVMVEESIIFANPPGTNGEKEFYNVMRKMYPNASGTTLTTTWTSSQTQNFSFSGPIPTYVYNKGQIGILWPTMRV
jgi:hypothetical protein